MALEEINAIYEPVTGTWQYIVACAKTKNAVIIDSVLDYDRETGDISTISADRLLNLVDNKKYVVTYILETHAHADHLTASRYLQHVLTEKQVDPRPLVGIGRRIGEVQEVMGSLFQIPKNELHDAFDVLFDDDMTFKIGELEAKVIHLPGHTPDHIGYVIGDNIFTGDSIFNPDVGSARCDFPSGSATQLYHSIGALLTYPEHFRLYTGHDYPPSDRDAYDDDSKTKAVPFTTVKQQKQGNKHVNISTKHDDFVSWRNERDSSLNDPKLLRISIETNIRGGRLPSASEIGTFTLAHIPNGVVRVGTA